MHEVAGLDRDAVERCATMARHHLRVASTLFQ